MRHGPCSDSAPDRDAHRSVRGSAPAPVYAPAPSRLRPVAGRAGFQPTLPLYAAKTIKREESRSAQANRDFHPLTVARPRQASATQPSLGIPSNGGSTRIDAQEQTGPRTGGRTIRPDAGAERQEPVRRPAPQGRPEPEQESWTAWHRRRSLDPGRCRRRAKR